MPSPIGPQPATTTTSSKVRLARSTACSAHDSGSTNAAWAGGRSALILCTRASRGVDHVARHRPRGAAFEAVDVVRLAHVVLPPHAVTTRPARHDLLAGHPVADRNTPALRRLVVELDNRADELVTGNHLGLGPSRPIRVSPELRGTVVALQVAGADADRLDLDQRLARARRRHRNLFHHVILGTVADHRLHRVGNVCTNCGNGAGGGHRVRLQEVDGHSHLSLGGARFCGVREVRRGIGRRAAGSESTASEGEVL